MAETESILLRRFVKNGDAEAFAELVKRYADPVYNTCRRILFDEAGAADAAQQTFYQLMCSANTIKGSLAGWIHAVATHNAIDTLRRNAARRDRERRYVFSKARQVDKWKDISPHIDRELEKLSLQHRDILIHYFFEGKTMTEIAGLNKTSQATVSRQVGAAVEELRTRFRKKGLIVSLFILKECIDHSTLQAAPAFMMTEVGKMSLIGTTTGVLSASTTAIPTAAAVGTSSIPALSTGAAKTTLTTLFSSAKAKVAAAVAVTAIGTGGIVIYNHTHKAQQDIPPVKTQLAAETPFGETSDAANEFTQPVMLSSQSGGGGFGGGVLQQEDNTDIPIDLTDPQSTIDTFTELLITDNLDQWADCFAHSQTFDALYGIMTDPQNDAERQFRYAFDSIGQPVEILDLRQTENGLAAKLLYAVYDPFEMNDAGQIRTWQPGDQFEVHINLQNITDEWKILSIDTTPTDPAASFHE